MKTIILSLLILFSTGAFLVAADQEQGVHTYSIVAFDPLNGDLGVAVQSKFLGVGPVVPWVKAGVGAIATQAWANTTYGPDGLSMIEDGMTAEEAGTLLVEKDDNAAYRQVGIVDAAGGVWVWTGDECNEWAGHKSGENYTVQGNLLAGDEVVREMARAFEETDDDLAVRLLAALDAGEQAGGDRRGSQSSALVVYRENGGYAGYNDRFIDLRVEDHEDPVGELKRLFLLWEEFLGMNARARTAQEFENAGNVEAAKRERKRVSYLAQQIIEREPEDIETLVRVGWMLTNQNVDIKLGLQLAQKAVLLDSDNRNALFLLGESYYAYGEIEESIETFEYALQKFPDDQQLQNRLYEILNNN